MEIEEQQKKESGLFIKGFLLGLLGTLFIVCTVYLAVNYLGVGKTNNENAYSEGSAITPQVVDKLQMLEGTIDKYFYLHEVVPEDLDEGMYKGMLQSLGDPYSEYYTATELENLMNQSEGVYYGIGAYVGLDSTTSLPRITSVIEGTPAEEAGLRANDIIVEVDGTSVYGFSLTEAVSMIKGEDGTEVTLTIFREGESDYLKIPVTRRKVESPTVNYEMLENDMGYIQIVEFDDVTVDQFADALATVKGSGMKGLILDLRGNPGGNLDAVVQIAGMMLPKGLVVYTEDKNGNRRDYTSDGKMELQVPMVVLVDGNSASASEVLSGAIKDYGKATLVGTTTFGKGIVQQIIPFTDGSAIKVTVSSYYTPNGENIHGIGIEPDVVCEFDGETYYNTEDHYDNQLEKAKEVLAEKMGLQK